MELLLKMTKGQPPFFGVVFENVIEACELNQNLINDSHAGEFKIMIQQPQGDAVSFKIFSSAFTGFWHYKAVKCDRTQLANWLYLNSNKQINFGHILRAFDRDTIVKTKEHYKPFVLKINNGVYMVE